ncbi:hypothetical protein BH24ACT26_BH24ACT26_06770 [soil metagenome]
MSDGSADLPSRRASLRGTDLDGNRVELAFGVSKKLYRCPGCHAHISVGSEHIVARFLEGDATAYHQHWHRDCARSGILRNLRSVEPFPARGGWPKGRRSHGRHHRGSR